jgi:DNA-binding transcriptional ArsR family regulator
MLIRRINIQISLDEFKPSSQKDPSDVLKGTTFEVYRLLIKTGKPIGVREVQRALKLSSASVATYHLSKLEDAGIVKRNSGGDYTVSKIILKDRIRVGHFLIPRYFFYIIFAVSILTIELTLFNPQVIDRAFFIYTIALTIIVLIFCYETLRKWLDNGI